MKTSYIIVAVGIAALAFAPAILAGGGFIITTVLFVAIAAALIGIPELWDLFKTKRMGSKGRQMDRQAAEDYVRDVMNGSKRPLDDDEPGGEQ